MARKKKKTGKPPGVPAAEFSSAAIRLAVPALVVLFSLFAWSQRGLYVDGFFYLRIVDVFLHSGVLAYNPAERYETNSDFLWSLLLIPGVAAGLRGILWMHIVGVAAYAAALTSVWALVRRLFPASDAALVALVLLGGHFSFAHFAASGFGAVLQALAAVCCLLALFHFGKSPNLRNGAALGFALLFLALCRLDSAVFGIPLVLCALYFAWQNGRAAAPAIVVAMAIPSVFFGGVLLWKLSYYGDILPATYYVKAASEIGGQETAAAFFRDGLAYMLLYWKRYFLWLFALIAAYGARQLLKKRAGRGGGSESRDVVGALLWTTGAMCVMWHCYMFRNGGDYLEFRFLIPSAPLLAILAAAGFRGLAQNWRWAAAAGALALSVLHWQTAPPELEGGVLNARHYLRGSGEPAPENLHPDIIGEYWQAVALRDLFGHLGKYPPEVRIAHSSGGPIAYMNPLLWTEMQGWADTRISQADPEDLWLLGAKRGGHTILALPQLVARLGANFLIAHLSAMPEVDFSRPVSAADIPPVMQWAMLASFNYNIVPKAKFPPDTQMVALPLPNGQFAPVVYFNRNQTIDGVLDERGIERVNLF